jgi:ubiquinone/menaquinone biosynthesis C-methylase UbiE
MRETDLKSETQRQWEAAAPGWAKWESVIADGLIEVTDTMLDMAGVEAGKLVIDLACGAGSQTIQAAKRVGPSGRVVASDISSTMLEHVRSSAERAGLDNIETHASAAEDLALVPGKFDAAICRLGLMLFPSPGQALDACRTALKPGARFAALVFTTPANNRFMAEPMQVLLRHADKRPPAPGQPGIFALGGSGVLRDLLVERGFDDVRTTTVRALFHLASTADALEMMRQAFGAYRAVISELDQAAQAAAWEEVGECIAQFQTDAGFQTELEFLIGSGAKTL